jgi:hypothetical protein
MFMNQARSSSGTLVNNGKLNVLGRFHVAVFSFVSHATNNCHNENCTFVEDPVLYIMSGLSVLNVVASNSQAYTPAMLLSIVGNLEVRG